MSAATFIEIPIEQLHESPLNPRRHFNQAKLEELAASIGSHGILTPLLARPLANAEGLAFELAAGHRRFRASQIAKLESLPVLVREMSDVEFIEVLTIENLQREDVHAIEEAQGYQDLLVHAGYDVARIAERVGRSTRYVYDRIKLLQLIPELQQIFFDNEITAGHAILLSRLSPVDQARALKETQALFTIDHGRRHRIAGEEPSLGLTDRRKAMSVRELQMWIDEHVRFDVEAEHVPELFPETIAIVAPALEQKEKVISITQDFQVHDSAKPEDGERTWGPRSWTRADGLVGSKQCDHSITGVIVVGPGRGEAFKVCTSKKTCKTHWASEIREAAKRAKARESGETTVNTPPARDRWAEESVREESARAKWEETLPAVLDAVAAKVGKMAAGAKGALGIMLIENARGRRDVSVTMAPGSSADELVRYLAFQTIADNATSWQAYKQFPKQAKALGLDVAQIIKAANAPTFPNKTAAKKSPAKKKVPR